MLGVAASACGGGSGAPVAAGDAPSPTKALYEATATVLESATHGPSLCLGAIATSYPPQCGTLPITNWDWTRVDGEESSSGTTWGDYHVAGTYADGAFTVTDVGPPRRGERGHERDTSTPCSPSESAAGESPAGPPDESSMYAAMDRARGAWDFAGAWLDTAGATTPSDLPDAPEGYVDVDYARVVLNVGFTGDVDRHRDELRTVWSGRLCVVRRAHRLADLERIKDELLPGGVRDLGLIGLTADADDVRNVVTLGVAIATPEAGVALDRRYGAGVVELVPELHEVSRHTQ